MKKTALSRQQLAGQRLMAGFDGTRFNREIRHLIEDLSVGGLILFSRNIETPEQVAALCAEAQASAASCGLPGLIIAIDQEGGQVARLKPPHFSSFPGNPEIRSLNDAETFATVTSRELRQVLVNMNFAPVLDVIPETGESIMSRRAFPGSPENVAELGSRVITTFQAQGIMAVAKHFPGIGRTRIDSHLDLPLLEAPLELLERTDLLPFRAAIECGVSGIMLSHILYTDLDPEWPASLSTTIARDLLRNKLGYTGVVMTDDLDMKAIRHDIPTCIRQILQADIDMVLICHAGPNIDIAFSELLAGISQSQEMEKRAEMSAGRILELKQRCPAINVR